MAVVRRASSLIAPRSSSSDRDDAASTKSSIKGINTTPSSVPPPQDLAQATKPSPIAESPARETASSFPAPTSALAQAPVIAPPIGVPVQQEGDPEQTSPEGYVPPPLLDSSAVGPGAFTDEPDELPQPQVIRDPSLKYSRESMDGYAEAPVEEAVVERPVVSEEVVVERAVEAVVVEPQVEPVFKPQVEPVFKPQVEPVVAQPQAESVIIEPQVERAVEVPIPVTQELQPTQPTTPVGEAASYFNLPLDEEEEEVVIAPQPVQEPTEGFKTAVEAVTSGSTTPEVLAPVPVFQEQERNRGFELVTPPREKPVPLPEQSAPTPAVVYPMPVYDAHEVWGGAPHTNKVGEDLKHANGDASTRSRVSSIRCVFWFAFLCYLFD